MRAMATNGEGAVRQDQGSDLQLLVNSAPSLLHTGTPDGYLDFFNQTWLRYVGRPLEDLQGWKWTAFIHPKDVEGIVEKWRASLASGEPFLHETRVLRADGEYRWMLHHKVARRNARGEIVKWHGSSIDIEDRKRAEEQLSRSTRELQRSEFYLAEGQRLAHMGSWAFDPAGFEYWSSELFRMHGLDPAREPPGVEEYLNCIHPQDREFMANLVNGLPAKASPFDATKRIVRPNGEVRYIRCVGVPVVEDQSLKKYVGSALDVTEHELVDPGTPTARGLSGRSPKAQPHRQLRVETRQRRDCLVRRNLSHLRVRPRRRSQRWIHGVPARTSAGQGACTTGHRSRIPDRH